MTTTTELPHGLLDLEPLVAEAIPYTVDQVSTRMTYIVFWPERGLAKAGFASARSRYRAWINRGATLIGLWALGAPGSLTERSAESLLAHHGVRAFASPGDVPADLAGPGGYTEFYRLDDEGAAGVAQQIQGRALVLV
jgi:hypothetical protein